MHDGFVLDTSVQRSRIGGRFLNDTLAAALRAREPPPRLHPYYQYSKVAKLSGAGTESVVRDLPDIAASQLAWGTSHIVADMKEAACRASEAPFVESENLNMPTQLYELPDGSTVEVGVERFKGPEALFAPARFRCCVPLARCRPRRRARTPSRCCVTRPAG